MSKQLLPDRIYHFNTKKFIGSALQEDLGDGDHTSLATIPSSAKGKAQLLAKENEKK